MSVKRVLWVSGSALVLLALVPQWVFAQSGIAGVVKDSSGAVLPGADVTVTQAETGVSRNTITNETGINQYSV